jgi:hypothetical protein
MDHPVAIGASHGKVIKPFGHPSIVRIRRFATKFALQYPAMRQAGRQPELRICSGRTGIRTHLCLEKDAPVSRTIERARHILCRPVLGGLHHQYVRI